MRKHSGLCQELFEKHDERPTSSFLYSLVMDSYSMGYTSSGFADMPLNHKIFLAQFDTIKKLADESSCVIVGRCADYALEEYPNVVSVFISGNDEDKIKRLMDVYHLSESKAKDAMIKTDKQRSSYYNYYSNKKWSDPRSYDLCINSSVTGPEGAVDVILNFAKVKQAWRQRMFSSGQALFGADALYKQLWRPLLWIWKQSADLIQRLPTLPDSAAGPHPDFCRRTHSRR